jgi:hypothetical protein
VKFPWFTSVSPDDCWDNYLNQAATKDWQKFFRKALGTDPLTPYLRDVLL